MQASKLANRAGPMTRSVTVSAAGWSKPKVGRVRAWMAVRAARGGVAMQENVAPRISSLLAATARRLDPPRPLARRWPKVLAGTAFLAAGAAAATALALRKRARPAPLPMAQRQPVKTTPDQRSKTFSSTAESEHAMAESNNMSKTR